MTFFLYFYVWTHAPKFLAQNKILSTKNNNFLKLVLNSWASHTLNSLVFQSQSQLFFSNNERIIFILIFFFFYLPTLFTLLFKSYNPSLTNSIRKLFDPFESILKFFFETLHSQLYLWVIFPILDMSLKPSTSVSFMCRLTHFKYFFKTF